MNSMALTVDDATTPAASLSVCTSSLLIIDDDDVELSTPLLSAAELEQEQKALAYRLQKGRPAFIQQRREQHQQELHSNTAHGIRRWPYIDQRNIKQYKQIYRDTETETETEPETETETETQTEEKGNDNETQDSINTSISVSSSADGNDDDDTDEEDICLLRERKSRLALLLSDDDDSHSHSHSHSHTHAGSPVPPPVHTVPGWFTCQLLLGNRVHFFDRVTLLPRDGELLSYNEQKQCYQVRLDPTEDEAESEIKDTALTRWLRLAEQEVWEYIDVGWAKHPEHKAIGRGWWPCEIIQLYIQGQQRLRLHSRQQNNDSSQEERVVLVHMLGSVGDYSLHELSPLSVLTWQQGLKQGLGERCLSASLKRALKDAWWSYHFHLHKWLMLANEERKRSSIDLEKRYLHKQVNGDQWLGQRVSVLWEEDLWWYAGVIQRFNAQNRHIFILYDDHEVEWLDPMSIPLCLDGLKFPQQLDIDFDQATRDPTTEAATIAKRFYVDYTLYQQHPMQQNQPATEEQWTQRRQTHLAEKQVQPLGPEPTVESLPIHILPDPAVDVNLHVSVEREYCWECGLEEDIYFSSSFPRFVDFKQKVTCLRCAKVCHPRCYSLMCDRLERGAMNEHKYTESLPAFLTESQTTVRLASSTVHSIIPYTITVDRKKPRCKDCLQCEHCGLFGTKQLSSLPQQKQENNIGTEESSSSGVLSSSSSSSSSHLPLDQDETLSESGPDSDPSAASARSPVDLLTCDVCDIRVHRQCVEPPLPETIKSTANAWICKQCLKCRACGITQIEREAKDKKQQEKQQQATNNEQQKQEQQLPDTTTAEAVTEVGHSSPPPSLLTTTPSAMSGADGEVTDSTSVSVSSLPSDKPSVESAAADPAPALCGIINPDTTDETAACSSQAPDSAIIPKKKTRKRRSSSTISHKKARSQSSQTKNLHSQESSSSDVVPSSSASPPASASSVLSECLWSAWCFSFTLCPSCSGRMSSRHYCPICCCIWDCAPMVECDRCKRWVHIACDESAAAFDPTKLTKTSVCYHCPDCVKREQAHEMIVMLDALNAADRFHYFLHPVTEQQAPDYSLTIKTPMDFTTIYNKLYSLSYTNVEQFKYDLNLVWRNAKDYNPSNSTIHRTAVRLQQKSVVLFEEMRVKKGLNGLERTEGRIEDQEETLNDDDDSHRYNKQKERKRQQTKQSTQTDAAATQTLTTGGVDVDMANGQAERTTADKRNNAQETQQSGLAADITGTLSSFPFASSVSPSFCPSPCPSHSPSHSHSLTVIASNNGETDGNKPRSADSLCSNISAGPSPSSISNAVVLSGPVVSSVASPLCPRSYWLDAPLLPFRLFYDPSLSSLLSHVDVCLLCGCTGDELHFLICADCGECMHWFCLDPNMMNTVKQLQERRQLRTPGKLPRPSSSTPCHGQLPFPSINHERRAREWRCPNCCVCWVCSCRGKLTGNKQTIEKKTKEKPGLDSDSADDSAEHSDDPDDSDSVDRRSALSGRHSSSGNSDNLSTMFLSCDLCDRCVHIGCLSGPPSASLLSSLSSGLPVRFLCDRCVFCRFCGSRVPGSSPSARWLCDYSACEACGRLWEQGHYCPVCEMVWQPTSMLKQTKRRKVESGSGSVSVSASQSIRSHPQRFRNAPMMCCEKCEKWVHLACDDLSLSEYHELQDSRYHYACPPCREQDESLMQQWLEQRVLISEQVAIKKQKKEEWEQNKRQAQAFVQQLFPAPSALSVLPLFGASSSSSSSLSTLSLYVPPRSDCIAFDVSNAQLLHLCCLAMKGQLTDVCRATERIQMQRYRQRRRVLLQQKRRLQRNALPQPRQRAGNEDEQEEEQGASSEHRHTDADRQIVRQECFPTRGVRHRVDPSHHRAVLLPSSYYSDNDVRPKKEAVIPILINGSMNGNGSSKTKANSKPNNNRVAEDVVSSSSSFSLSSSSSSSSPVLTFSVACSRLFGGLYVRDSRLCFLCGLSGDLSADSKSPGRLLPAHPFHPGLGSVHIQCALWASAPYGSINESGWMTGIFTAVNKTHHRVCCHCDQPGASLLCRVPSHLCGKAYHYPCAIASSCVFTVDKRMFCPSHADKAVLPNRKTHSNRVHDIQPLYCKLLVKAGNVDGKYKMQKLGEVTQAEQVIDGDKKKKKKTNSNHPHSSSNSSNSAHSRQEHNNEKNESTDHTSNCQEDGREEEQEVAAELTPRGEKTHGQDNSQHKTNVEAANVRHAVSSSASPSPSLSPSPSPSSSSSSSLSSSLRVPSSSYHIRVGGLTVSCLGSVVSSDLFHSSLFVYSVGFLSYRLYWSYQHPGTRTGYHCSINQEADHPQQPIFHIQADDDQQHIIRETTAEQAVKTLINRIQEAEQQQQQQLPASVSSIPSLSCVLFAPYFFGFGHPLLLEFVEYLPGVSQLPDVDLLFNKQHVDPIEEEEEEGMEWIQWEKDKQHREEQQLEFAASVVVPVNETGCARCQGFTGKQHWTEKQHYNNNSNNTNSSGKSIHSTHNTSYKQSRTTTKQQSFRLNGINTVTATQASTTHNSSSASPTAQQHPLLLTQVETHTGKRRKASSHSSTSVSVEHHSHTVHSMSHPSPSTPSSSSSPVVVLPVTSASSLAQQYRVMKSSPTRARVGHSLIHEWGLFATEVLEPNTMVIEYLGESIRQKVADIRERRYEETGIGSCYMFRIDDDLIIDATKKGNTGRFINHSCDPNSVTRIIEYNGSKKIAVITARRVAVGEELTYDYFFANEADRIACNCGARNCAGRLN